MSNPHKLKLPKGFIKSIESVKRLDDKGLLYYIDYKANYYLLESFVNMLAKPACSTFLVDNEKNEKLFCRNYDFVHYKYNDRKNDMTALNIVVHSKNWGAKYESIGVADGFWLDVAKGRLFEGCLDDGTTDISALALIPYLCMDGMNSKGLAVSIMHLFTKNEWTEIEYKPFDSLSDDDKKKCIHLENKGEVPQELDIRARSGFIAINDIDKKAWSVNKNFAVWQKKKGRRTMFHPVLMRRMLDYCKNVDEAIKLAKKTNVRSPLPDNDYHIMVSDRTGRSVILEWKDNELYVKETKNGTNYYLTRDDKFGYGQDRFDFVQKEIDKNNGVLKDDKAIKLLEDVSQDFRCNKFAGFTLWTSLYNLTTGDAKIYQYMDYNKSYDFKIKVK